MIAPDAPRLDPFATSEEEIEHRLRVARRAGHPRYVWGDVPMSSWAAGMRAVEGAVTQALARTSPLRGGSPTRLETTGEVTARALSVAAFTSGTGPLLGHWIEQGVLGTPAGVASVLAGHLAHARARAQRIRGHLEALAPALARSGLRPVLLKGAHTAWRYFPEPGTRPSSDVDLFVPSSQGTEAERILAEEGFRLRLRQRRPVRSVWMPPGETGRIRSLEVTHAQNPLTLDLHCSLDRDFYGVRHARVPDPAAEDREPVPGLPAPFQGLRGPMLMLNLSLHASEDLYNLQLLRVVELVLVARGAPDPEALWRGSVEMALGWRALGDASPALALAARLDARAVPEAVVAAARAEAPPALRALVDGLSPGTAQRLEGITLSERLSGARTPAEKLRRIGEGPRQPLRIPGLPAPARAGPHGLEAHAGGRKRIGARGS